MASGTNGPGYCPARRLRSSSPTSFWTGPQTRRILTHTPGTVDADYRGEVKIIMMNHSKENLVVKRGDRIAQMIINKVEKIEFEEVAELTTTNRGSGGFGHTGK